VPEFAPNSTHNAVATFHNPKSAGFDYSASFCMGTGWTEMAVASFPLDGGQSKPVQFPITMPSAFGEYPVGFKVSSGGKLIGALADPATVSIVGPPELVYVSDIRRQSYQRPGYPSWARGIEFWVDIKNTGGMPGNCTPIAYIEDCYNMNVINMGTQTINPGQTVTFYGNWYWPYGEREPDEWWRAQSIQSEAGAISFDWGRRLYLVSFDIPAQILSGSEFWATQVVHLPGAQDMRFACSLILKNVKQGTASRAKVGGSGFPWVEGEYGENDIVMMTEGDCTIRGVYSHSVSYPAKAEYWDRPNYIPLPPGLYDVISQIRWQRNTSYGVCWDNYVIGQVEIV